MLCGSGMKLLTFRSLVLSIYIDQMSVMIFIVIDLLPGPSWHVSLNWPIFETNKMSFEGQKPSWFFWPRQVQLLPFNKTDKMKNNRRGVTVSFWCNGKNYDTSLTCFSTFTTETLTWEGLKTLWAKTKPLLKHEHWKYEEKTQQEEIIKLKQVCWLMN